MEGVHGGIRGYGGISQDKLRGLLNCDFQYRSCHPQMGEKTKEALGPLIVPNRLPQARSSREARLQGLRTFFEYKFSARVAESMIKPGR